MSLQLSPELEEMVLAKVQSGRYTSANDVVRDALNLMDQRDVAQSGHLPALRARMDQALAESARGEATDGEEFMLAMLDELDRKHGRNAG